MRSTLRRYNADQLQHINTALNDYRQTLEDESGQLHFTQQYQAAYDHLDVAYPIPEQVVDTRPINEHISSLLSASFQFSETNSFLRAADIRLVRLNLLNIVYEASHQVLHSLMALDLERKIKDDPMVAITLENLKCLIEYFSAAQLSILLSGQAAKNVVALLSQRQKLTELMLYLNEDEGNSFFALFSQMIDDEVLYEFLENQTPLNISFMCHFFSIQQLANGLRKKGDLLFLTSHVPESKRHLVVNELVQSQCLLRLVLDIDDFKLICFYSNLYGGASLQKCCIEQIKEHLVDLVRSASDFMAICSEPSLRPSEKETCFRVLEPSIRRYFVSVADFNILTKARSVTEEVKQNICEIVLRDYNRSVENRHVSATFFEGCPRRDPIVFLAGVVAISNFFSGDGGLNIRTALGCMCERQNASISDVVSSMKRHVHYLETSYTLSCRSAVKAFIERWERGDLAFNVTEICEQVRAQTLRIRVGLLSPAV